ncbi:unnamed protein product [Microthlaspi erraticum]|uniref:Uncharacterized protein n=1 Tax=Microthlaspi erraticum TaxID=1685480 RepID=A0A6D2IWG1_9BRAS|nr:unnamed protein product [Microthlaspi erraticum]
MPSTFVRRLESVQFVKVELPSSIEEDQREQVGPVAVPSAVAPAIQPRSQQQQPEKRRGPGFGKGGKLAQGQKRRWDEDSGGSQSDRGVYFGCGSRDHRVASCPKRIYLGRLRIDSADRGYAGGSDHGGAAVGSDRTGTASVLFGRVWPV